MSVIDRRISIAPMMDCTDRHFRYLLRLIAPQVLLYTEMVTTGALIHGDRHRFLKYHEKEHPLALQLGGHDPKALAECALMAEDYQYDEINLNVGCPSDRVQSGRFGACLMLQPELVAECIAAMAEKVKMPVTVKCRIGVDHQDSYESLKHFIQIVSDAGSKVFIIHARKAWLSGLSPKQNREVPPLRYEVVYQIKKDFPHLDIVINGGLKDLSTIEAQFQYVDGVMIGREAYANPYFLSELHQKFYAPNTSPKSLQEIVEDFLPYVETQLNDQLKLSSLTRHILNLFHGQFGGRLWRRYLSEQACRLNADISVIREALKFTQEILS